MKCEVENLSPVKKTLIISVPEDAVQEEIATAFVDLKKHAVLPGFRKGKIPQKVLERKFGARVESDVLDTILRRSFSQAITEHKLEIVSYPEIADSKREPGQGFQFKATVEVKPDFEPKGYTDITLTKSKDEVGKKQIDEVISRLQNEHAVLKVKEGVKKPSKGDFVSLFIQGVKEDGTLTTPENEPREQIYEVGGEILHKEIDKAVRKLSVGESAQVKITVDSKKDIPSEDNANAPKEFFVKVTLNAIKEKELPLVDDEFAKTLGPFQNLKELTDRIEADLKQELEDKNQADLTRSLLDKISSKNEFPLPESLIEQETQMLIRGFLTQLFQAGATQLPADYNEEEMKQRVRPDAERRVREQLLVEAIAKKEKIQVSDGEVNERIAQEAKAKGIPMGELRAQLEKNHRIHELEFHLLAQKTVDFLLAKAKIQ